MDLSHLYASSLCISFPLIIAPVAHLFCEHSVKQFNEKQLKIGFLCKNLTIDFLTKLIPKSLSLMTGFLAILLMVVSYNLSKTPSNLFKSICESPS